MLAETKMLCFAGHATDIVLGLSGNLLVDHPVTVKGTIASKPAMHGIFRDADIQVIDVGRNFADYLEIVLAKFFENQGPHGIAIGWSIGSSVTFT